VASDTGSSAHCAYDVWTSTRVEHPCLVSCSSSTTTAHPRARGNHLNALQRSILNIGPSTRVRGNDCAMDWTEAFPVRHIHAWQRGGSPHVVRPRSIHAHAWERQAAQLRAAGIRGTSTRARERGTATRWSAVERTAFGASTRAWERHGSRRQEPAAVRCIHARVGGGMTI
jgi:hypothetical protein